MKGKVKVLNSKGHTSVKYDTEAGVVEEAEKILMDAAGQGAALFDGGTRERIETGGGRKRILAEHEEIIVVPPMAGG